MNLKFFTLHELCYSKTAVENNISNIPSWDAVNNLFRLGCYLDTVRWEYGSRVYISSGFRCPELNKLVGGAVNSLHQDGRAADIYADDLKKLYDAVKTFVWSECYINEDKNFIHVAI